MKAPRSAPPPGLGVPGERRRAGGLEPVPTAPVGRARRPAGLLGMISRVRWAVADQVLISGSNFVTMVLLGRTLSPGDFGGFSMVYMALLLANTVQAGVVTQPHNILGAALSGEAYRRYTTSTALSQLALGLVSTALALAAWGIARAAGWSGAPLLLALSPAILAWQVQELARRVLYTEGRHRSAFLNDAVSYGGQAAMVLALWHAGGLTGMSALLVLAATSALAAAMGAWQLRGSLSRAWELSCIRENWHFGKWLVGGELIGVWLSGQLFIWIAASMLGAGAVGAIRAVHTVFGPTRILSYVFESLLPVRFARAVATGGREALRADLARAVKILVPLLLAFCLVVGIFARPVLGLLYGDKYVEYAPLLALNGVSYCFGYAAMIYAAALRAARLTDREFVGRLSAALVATPLGYALIGAFGLYGVVFGVMINTLISGSFLWWAFGRIPPHQPKPHIPEGGPTMIRDEVDEACEAQAADPMFLPTGDRWAILTRVFEELDRAGIPFCVTHGYEGFPEAIASDVDCIMPAAVLPRRLAELLHAKRERIGAELVQWLGDDAHYVVLAGRGPDGSPQLLALHVSSSLRAGVRELYSAEDFQRDCRRRGPFWIPAPAVAFGSLLSRRVLKGVIDDGHARRLGDLYRDDEAGCRRELARLWPGPGPGATALAHAAEVGDWSAIRPILRALRRELAGPPSLKTLASGVQRGAAGLRDRVARWRRPCGLHVVFLGPDGVGKSTIIDAVSGDLRPAFAATAYRTFAPMLTRRPPPAGRGPKPHAMKIRSRPASYAKAAYWLAYYTVGYVPTAHRDKARAALIINHRYLVDALVDPRRYRYSGPVGLLRLIWRVAPKPDMIVVLDAPAEVIQARKQEVPPEETARQLSRYRALVASQPGACLVDADRPPGEVAIDVEDRILRMLAARVRRRLGLGLGADRR